MAAQGSGLIVNVTYAFPHEQGNRYLGHLLYDLAKASLSRWVGGVGVGVQTGACVLVW